MAISGVTVRLRAAFVLLTLLAAPVGPGGAWHVALYDVADASLTGRADPRVRSDASAHGPEHGGPSCAVCHLLQGLRWVVPAVFAVDPAAPVATSLISAAASDPRAGRTPFRAGRSPPVA